MGVDKSYGSGKPRSAANSRARARVAAGRMTKGKKRPVDNLVSRAGKAVGFAGGVADFILNGPKETRGKYAELGVSTGVMARAATALLKAGSKTASRGVLERASAKVQGNIVGKIYAQSKALTPAGARGPKLTDKFYADQIKTGQYLKTRSAVNMAKSRAPKLPTKRGR